MNFIDNLSKINFFILIILCYYIFTKTENMSNEDISKQINEIYKADISAIRNLSKLANDLTVNKKLVVPGGLEVKGNVNITGHLHSSQEISSAKGLYTSCKKYGTPSSNCGVHIRPDGLIKATNIEATNHIKAPYAYFGNGMIQLGSEKWSSVKGAYKTNNKPYIILKHPGYGDRKLSLQQYGGGAFDFRSHVMVNGHLHSTGEVSSKSGFYTACKNEGTPSSGCGVHVTKDKKIQLGNNYFADRGNAIGWYNKQNSVRPCCDLGGSGLGNNEFTIISGSNQIRTYQRNNNNSSRGVLHSDASNGNGKGTKFG